MEIKKVRDCIAHSGGRPDKGMVQKLKCHQRCKTDPLARIDHRFGNEGDFGRPERFSESFAIDSVQVE